ncbi:hypothetical protein ACIF6K_23745 [Streptomyces sp. NPDC085942]|uniref:hypothetical protein n=1 Tax=Streptomyces sp. NPDC085942 TaxID=3365743 RepID=UPI0037D3A480
MRQMGVPPQRQPLLEKLLVTSHIFGFLGVILSIALLAMGMTAGSLTFLGITLAIDQKRFGFWVVGRM